MDQPHRGYRPQHARVHLPSVLKPILERIEDDYRRWESLVDDPFGDADAPAAEESLKESVDVFISAARDSGADEVLVVGALRRRFPLLVSWDWLDPRVELESTESPSWTEASDAVTFPVRRALWARLFIFFASLSGVGGWVLWTVAVSGERLHGPYLAQGLTALALIALMSPSVLIHTCRPGPGFVLTETGIYDYASPWFVGLIPWEDVTGLSLFKYYRSLYLMIEVADPAEYQARRGWSARQWYKGIALVAYSKVDRKMREVSPVYIGEKWLRSGFLSLVEECQRYLEKYGKQGAIHRTRDMLERQLREFEPQ